MPYGTIGGSLGYVKARAETAPGRDDELIAERVGDQGDGAGSGSTYGRRIRNT